MGLFGGFYKGDRKKLRKERLEKLATKIKRVSLGPQVEIIGKKGK